MTAAVRQPRKGVGSREPRALLGNRLGLMFVVSAALGALSLLILGGPSAPGANSWLVWGRQISDLQQVDLSIGPSWKPLPVVISIPFQVLSPQGAALFWIWLVRACAVLCITLTVLLVAPRYGRIAAVASAALPWAVESWNQAWISGESEPVFVACLLGSFLLIRVGRTPLAFWLAVLAGLLRPEAWVLIAGIGILWALRDRWVAVLTSAVGAAVLAAAWFFLPWAMGNDPMQASSRAKTVSVYPDTGIWDGGLSYLPWLAVVLVPLGFVAAWVNRDRLLMAFGGLSLLYCLQVVAGELLLGYSGASRYYVPVVFGLLVMAGPGVWLILRLIPRGRFNDAISVLLAASVILSVASESGTVKSKIDEYRGYQAAVGSAAKAFNEAGGLGSFKGCRPFGASPYFQRILARKLEVSLGDVKQRVIAPTVAFDPGSPMLLPPVVWPPTAKGELLATTGQGWKIRRYGRPALCEAP